MTGGQRNPLKRLVSDKRIQGKPSRFLGKIWLGSASAWLGFEKFGFGLEVGPTFHYNYG